MPKELFQNLASADLKTQQNTKKIDIAYVSENTSIIDLALEAGLDLLEQTGGDYICLCPFHDDRDTPSLRIYTVTNTWHCFGCNAGSSVFDFIMHQESIGFQEALMTLAARVGYDGTYVLRDIKTGTEGEKFSSIKLKIELAFLKKYIYYIDKKKNFAKSKEEMKILYNTVEKFWSWYDEIQIVFDTKVWAGLDAVTLEDKMYEFYTHALNHLNVLDEENRND